MKVSITRDELKKQAKLLKLLEEFEVIQRFGDEYSGACLYFKMDSSIGRAETRFIVQGISHRRGEDPNEITTAIEQIIAKHFAAALKESVKLIRDTMDVEVD